MLRSFALLIKHHYTFHYNHHSGTLGSGEIGETASAPTDLDTYCLLEGEHLYMCMSPIVIFFAICGVFRIQLTWIINIQTKFMDPNREKLSIAFWTKL